MNDRPFILRGRVKVIDQMGCIIGKVIKNDNVENKDMYIQVLDEESMEKFSEGYCGYIFEKEIKEEINANYAYCINSFETIQNNDVLQMIDNDCVKVLYRDDSDDNALVVTNQCNSNCIMCPDSDVVRYGRFNPNIDLLIRQIRCIPSDVKYITITGGEPGMLKYDLIKVLEECRNTLPETEFLLLTNGRVFSNKIYCDKIVEVLPSKIRFAIPIYADNEKQHDEITRAQGSFNQTLLGINRLLKNNVDIELRIVVLKKNYKILENIAKFIVKELKNVKMVNIMALEMMGNAYKNRDDVWINFEEVQDYLYDSAIYLIKNGIPVNLYNFPLCNINEKLYSISHKSISDYKVRFKEECEKCLVKDMCGGFFNSTINVKSIKVKPIEGE